MSSKTDTNKITGSTSEIETTETVLSKWSNISGLHLKYVSLVLLTAQNAAYILLMRHVRTRTGDKFLATTAVIVQESIKCLVSLLIIFVSEGGFVPWLQHLYNNIVREPLDCLKISVPSLVFTLQNILIIIAVSNLDAATFQVTYQLKILTTAILSVIMLKKQLSKIQWTSLLVLFVGVSIVQTQPEDVAGKNAGTNQNQFLGLAAVITACMLSGFAGVYFEKILKGTKPSVWLRNVQLGGIGAFVGLITMTISEGNAVREKGFFHGWDSTVWCVIFLQAFGGLIVAVVVKYADNILKVFATSMSIIISCVVSIVWLNFELSVQFSIGAGLVMLSTYLYGRFVPEKKPQLSDVSNGKVQTV